MRAISSLFALLAALALSGCGLVYKMEINQGNYVTQEMVAQLKPGMTRDQVRFVLGTPLLAGRRTTALTSRMERFAILLTRGALGDHYRTYAETVEAEARRAVGHEGAFDTGPLIPRYATAERRDTGFIVEDGPYLSARWPGDAWTLAQRMCERL